MAQSVFESLPLWFQIALLWLIAFGFIGSIVAACIAGACDD